MADDDRAVLERLAALEAEVKSEADGQRARKDAALARLREQRVTQAAERDAARGRQAERVSKRRDADSVLEDIGDRGSRAGRGSRNDQLDNLGGAMELASKANRVKNELARPTKKGDKSWIASGVASLALGPVGWLYAGSMREAVPATAGWLAVMALMAKILPAFLLMPVLMVALPLSAVAGVVYALQYNRSGTRQRLFNGDKKSPKQLRGE